MFNSAIFPFPSNRLRLLSWKLPSCQYKQFSLIKDERGLSMSAYSLKAAPRVIYQRFIRYYWCREATLSRFRFLRSDLDVKSGVWARYLLLKKVLRKDTISSPFKHVRQRVWWHTRRSVNYLDKCLFRRLLYLRLKYIIMTYIKLFSVKFSVQLSVSMHQHTWRVFFFKDIKNSSNAGDAYSKEIVFQECCYILLIIAWNNFWIVKIT